MTITIQYIRYLVLLLTTRCNLRCKYCYCPPKATQLDMSFSTMKKAIDIAASHGKHFHVQLSGGEPCLNHEMIFQSVQYIRENAPQATIAIQTNATMLNDEIIFFLKNNLVQIGVSIDGPPEIHNKIRGKFKELFSGLEHLDYHNVPWRVTTVVTSENITQLWRLVVLLSRFSTFRGIGLDFLTLKQNAFINGIMPANSEMIEIGMTKFLDMLKLCNIKRMHKIKFREADMLYKQSFIERSAFCNACKGQSLAVYPDGTVYPCSQLAGEKMFCAGNVNDSIDFSKLFLKEAELKNENCLSCVLNTRCPGDCQSRLINNGKDISQSICKLYQIIYRNQKKETFV